MSEGWRTGARAALRIGSLVIMGWAVAVMTGPAVPVSAQENENNDSGSDASEEDRARALRRALEERRRRQREERQAEQAEDQPPATPPPAAQTPPPPAPAAQPAPPSPPSAPATVVNGDLSPQQRLQLIEESQQSLQDRLLQQERVLFEQNEQLRQQFEALQDQALTIRQQQSVIDDQNRDLLDLRTQLSVSGPAPANQPRAGQPLPAAPLPAVDARSADEIARAEAVRRAQERARERRLAQEAAAEAARREQAAQAAAPGGQPGAPVSPGDLQPESNPALADDTRRATRPQTERPPEVEAVPEGTSVLTPKRALSLDLSVNYTFSNVNRVEVAGFTVLPAVAIGSFDIREVDRQSVVTAASLKYGLAQRVEFEVRAPFVMRNDDTIGRPLLEEASDETFESISGAGLGDIEFGLRHQLNTGQGGWPYLTYGIKAKAPTGRSPFDVDVDPATGLERELPVGTGFWTITPSLSAILPTDPGVLYASASYQHNLAKFLGADFGKIKPGDTFTAGLGLGFSLNPKVSLSIGTNYSVTYRTRQNGTPVAGSQRLYAGSLSLGYSYRFNPSTSVSFSVSPGFTSDAPDLTMGLRLPIRF